MLDEIKVCKTYKENKQISLNDIKKMFNINRYDLDRILSKNKIIKRKNQSKYIQKNRKLFFNEQFFLQKTPETAYFMGFCLADGSLFKPKNGNWTWYIGIHFKDFCIIKMFLKWLNLKNKDYYKYKYKRIIRLTGHFFSKDFSNWGIVPNKTYEAVKPKIISKNLIKPFLIGLLDGDGSISFDKKRGYKISLVCNTKIIKWFIKTIKSLGYTEKVTLKKYSKKIMEQNDNIS